ncbi:uncharacterized protein B0H64DRAFT_229728 [Chaetomium fimeti]|uniref:Uncharacterized protein n=1 Tax=Chaetomium fimeti TaxID=1854472 RepID=A0AAE0H9L0_9PEZI|nr:hypothetical protein B0H64DRAFT_229728 [Chaetomium fimeti]
MSSLTQCELLVSRRTAVNPTTCSRQARHLILTRRVTFDCRISNIPWCCDTATEYHYITPAPVSRLGGSTATAPHPWSGGLAVIVCNLSDTELQYHHLRRRTRLLSPASPRGRARPTGGIRVGLCRCGNSSQPRTTRSALWRHTRSCPRSTGWCHYRPWHTSGAPSTENGLSTFRYVTSTDSRVSLSIKTISQHGRPAMGLNYQSMPIATIRANGDNDRGCRYTQKSEYPPWQPQTSQAASV